MNRPTRFLATRVRRTPVRAAPACRSGVVLLIVMAMLALFAIVGLSFVYYAESTAETARLGRQAEALDDVTPEFLFAYALSQLIFDTDNPNSALRGHSLGRSLYGVAGGTVPFSGLGRPHPDTVQTFAGLTPFGGINVPYTYPDINNPFLASLDPDNPGFLKERSFYRNGSSLRPASLPASPNGEGDVRNVESLDGAISPTNPAVKFHNDAFWMDLGFPIITAKDGTRYKPLFAFTVLDLDGRLNLSVAGNYKVDYTKSGGTSRGGLGTFELNPARVLTTDKAEIANLFKGNSVSGVLGRYGADSTPDNPLRFPVTRVAARVDYTGRSPDTASPATSLYSHLPTFGDWQDIGWKGILSNEVRWGPNMQIWEAPSQARWTKIDAQPHALGFDYFGAREPANANGDRKLAASNAEAILRWRDRGAHALTSDLIRLLPNNLDVRATGGPAIFNRITPFSMSLDTAHLAPFRVSNPRDSDPNNLLFHFQWKDGDPYPTASMRTQTVPAALAEGIGEFTPDFRSQGAALLPRINLNRHGGFLEIGDSQALAKEIFDRLVQVTGAIPPSQKAPFYPVPRPNDKSYKATRWLAQLAVNIVDFLDVDDDMTPFRWNTSVQPTAADYVFGVEMNRMLINEVYVSADNDKNDLKNNQGAATIYRLNAWAELFCPAPEEANVADFGGEVLGWRGPAYRLLLSTDTQGIAASTTGLPANLLYAWNDPTQGVTDWGWDVYPGDRSPGIDALFGGFYVAGPTNFYLDSRKPTMKAPDGRKFLWNYDDKNINSPGMQSKPLPMPANEQALADALAKMKVTLSLQRRARTYQPANEDPANPLTYNPFVTVDFFPDIPVCNSVQFIGRTEIKAPPLGSFRAIGRVQPMQAAGVKPQFPDPPKTGEPQHTFFLQNAKSVDPISPGDLKVPFDTVYHLNRAFISPAEALLAPAVPPWEVTQRFGKQPISAYAICQNDPNSFLFRFLETVTTGDRSYNRQLAPLNPMGVAGGGPPAVLVPGKINLNTVADERVIEALFDRQSNSVFTDDDVHQFWLDLLEIRKSRPIAGFSDYTLDRNGTLTLHNTLIGSLFKKMNDRAAASGKNEFEATEGLRKVMNNITFTSNAFAVWVTAGFFEVDGAGNPVREIGNDEGRQTRHRLFAIVDRSQLVLPAPPTPESFAKLTADGVQGKTTATLSATAGRLRSQDPRIVVDFPWAIKPGTALTIDKDQPNVERVIVQEVTGNQIRIAGAGFGRQHKAGATVDLAGVAGAQVPLNRAADGATVPNFMLGYPGPQPQFNLREYTYVVPYYNIID